LYQVIKYDGPLLTYTWYSCKVIKCDEYYSPQNYRDTQKLIYSIIINAIYIHIIYLHTVATHMENDTSASNGGFLECKCCFDIFNHTDRQPMVLQCGHTICKNCTAHVQLCPWCRIKIVSLTINYHIYNHINNVDTDTPPNTNTDTYNTSSQIKSKLLPPTTLSNHELAEQLEASRLREFEKEYGQYQMAKNHKPNNYTEQQRQEHEHELAIFIHTLTQQSHTNRFAPTISFNKIHPDTLLNTVIKYKSSLSTMRYDSFKITKGYPTHITDNVHGMHIDINSLNSNINNKHTVILEQYDIAHILLMYPVHNTVTKYLFKNSYSNVAEYFRLKSPHIIIAALFGNIEMVKYLVCNYGHLKIEDTPYIDAPNTDGNTALCAAICAQTNTLPIITYLIENHAYPGTKNAKGETVLFFALNRKNIDYEPMKYIIDRGVNINAPDHHGNTILCNALSHNITLESITNILRCGADINCKNRLGETPLLHLTRHLRDTVTFELISYFVEHGSDINAKDVYGNTPLINIIHISYASQILALMKYLIDHGADMNVNNTYGETPMIAAIKLLPEDIGFVIVKYLFECDANINTYTERKTTALQCAVLHNKVTIVKYLVDNDADIQLRDVGGYTALENITIRLATDNSSDKHIVQRMKCILQLREKRNDEPDVQSVPVPVPTPAPICNNQSQPKRNIKNTCWCCTVM